jgi:hypothetical protein
MKMTIADKALLVQLQISQWTARKRDKKATEDVAKAAGADVSAGNYNKSLLAGTDALKKVHQYSTVIRTWYYDNTLSWGINGTQLLPSKNYFEFNTEWRQHKAKWEELVNEFCKDYMYHRAHAQQFLGTLYNDDDYPNAVELKRKFHIDMATFPVPSTDFRVEVGEQELQRIQQEVELRVSEAAEKAMSDLWHRLYERIEHVTERLSDSSVLFRDSMTEHTLDLCRMLPRLNFNDDPNLDRMCKEIEHKIGMQDPHALRYDLDLREQKAKEAKDIMDKMSVFMNGFNN